MKALKYIGIGLLFMGMTTLIGCKKEDPKPNPTSTEPVFNNGNNGVGGSGTTNYTLRFTCTSSNPYLIEIDGNSDVIGGSSYKNYTLKKGTYAWKVTQQSGYLFYPTVNSGTVTLDQDREIVFPQ